MRSCTERCDLGGLFPLKMSPNHHLMGQSGVTELASCLIIVMGHKSHVSSVHWEKEGDTSFLQTLWGFRIVVTGVLMAIVTVVI